MPRGAVGWGDVVGGLGGGTVQSECLMLTAGKLILGRGGVEGGGWRARETISQRSPDKRLSYFISSHLAFCNMAGFPMLKI